MATGIPHQTINHQPQPSRDVILVTRQAEASFDARTGRSQIAVAKLLIRRKSRHLAPGWLGFVPRDAVLVVDKRYALPMPMTLKWLPSCLRQSNHVRVSVSRNEPRRACDHQSAQEREGGGRVSRR